MAESEKFSSWVDAGALLAFERQLHFADVVGDYERWDVDLAQQSLTLKLADRELVCQAQLLGSSAPGPQSWLWGWANSNVDPNAVTLADRLRQVGEAEGVPELADAEIPLGVAGNEPPEAFWYRLATAVTPIATGFDGYFRAPLGGGTLAPLFIAHDELKLPPADGPRVLRVLSETFMAIRITDHRLAVRSYAEHRGIPFTWVTGAEATLAVPEGVITVEFNRETLLVQAISGTLGGS